MIVLGDSDRFARRVARMNSFPSQLTVPMHEITLVLTLDKENNLHVNGTSNTLGDARQEIGDDAWQAPAIEQLAGRVAEIEDQGVHTIARRNVSKALFPRAIRTWIEGHVLELGIHENWRLFLRLVIFDAELGRVPWELARLEGISDEVLVADPRFSLVRDVAKGDKRPRIVLGERIRVLHVKALKVDGFPKLDDGDGEHLRSLRNDIAALEVEEIEDATAQELEWALRTRPDILHFSGHGTREGLVLNAKRTDEETHVVMTADQLVGAVLNRRKPAAGGDEPLRPQIVVLACCHAGSEDASNDWSGVASALVERADVAAVIAMQQTVSDQRAADFTLRFYQKLLETGSVHEAVARARLALGASQYSVPVVYSCAQPMPGASVEAVSVPEPAAVPRVVVPAASGGVIVPEHACAVSTRSGTLAIAPLGDAVERVLFSGVARTSWTPGGAVEAVELAQAGGFAVALADGTLHIAILRATGEIAKWDAFPAPAGYHRLLAAGRRDEEPWIEVLLAGPQGHVSVSCFYDTPEPVLAPAPTALLDAAGTPDGFLMIDGDGRLLGPSWLPADLMEADGWFSIDHAVCSDAGVTVAARTAADGRASIYVAVSGEEHPRTLNLTGADRVRVVRPLDRTPPAAIVVQHGSTLREWAIASLPSRGEA